MNPEHAVEAFIGRTVGSRFTIHDHIGTGEMGYVYSGHEISSGRRVAIKVLGRRYDSKADETRKFIAEAKAASELSHPNIVPLIAFGQTKHGFLYLVTELLEGYPLTQRLERDGPLATADVLGYVIAAGSALGAAHGMGIIHRDMKPANLFICEEDGREQLKVLDFGVARTVLEDDSMITQSGNVMGTPAYLPPESIAEGECGPLGDLYSLGVTMFELLSGEVPYKAQSPIALLYKHMESPTPELPPALGVSAPVQAFIQRLMAKSPDGRYPSADEMAKVAQELLDAETGGAVATGGATGDQADVSVDTTTPSAPGMASTPTPDAARSQSLDPPSPKGAKGAPKTKLIGLTVGALAVIGWLVSRFL